VYFIAFATELGVLQVNVLLGMEPSWNEATTLGGPVPGTPAAAALPGAGPGNLSGPVGAAPEAGAAVARGAVLQQPARAWPEEGDDDAEAAGDFGGGDGDDNENEHLAVVVGHANLGPNARIA